MLNFGVAHAMTASLATQLRKHADNTQSVFTHFYLVIIIITS